MEYNSVHRGTRTKSAHSDGDPAFDYGAGSPISEDFTLSGLLSFDGLVEPSSPLAADLFFSSFINNSCLNPMFGNCSPSTFPCGLEQVQDSNQEDEGTSGCGYSRFNEKLAAQKSNVQTEFSPNCVKEVEFALDANDSQLDSVHNAVKWTTSAVLKSVGGFTFSDRMLRVLSLLKESSDGDFLAQVWMPVKQGDNYVLSTCEQPFLLDQVLAGYREVSRVFTFSTEKTDGLFSGLPGRVFMSGLPEWTSNVIYYNKCEYLRVEHAVSHEVRGSLAVPIFDPNKFTCFAVLELVTMKEKLNFITEMENVCQALQVVDLRMTKAHAHHQNLTKDQNCALSEILDVLRAVCHAHMLPLALTWMPMALDSELVGDYGDAAACNPKWCLKENKLCIQESACYVNDPQMHGFLQACSEHYLEKGQGVAGKAFQSNHPFYSPDVKGYDIGDYPLAHHARKFDLHAAVAIRLRSTYTGDDDFILEFFLPVSCKGSAEQQLLLNNLSVTMQRICRSLRTVLDGEAARPEVSKVDTTNVEETNSQSSEVNARNSQSMYNKNSQISDRKKDAADTPAIGENMESPEQVKYGSQLPRDKKRIASVKHISLIVLQKYFSGSLKDAAVSLGVCPTTLKRICRQHGISRWPSRKIKKVNQSLKKIQCVINSVQGAEGTFKYDPESGCLVAAVTSDNLATITPQPMNDDVPLPSAPRIEDRQFDEKLEPNNNKQVKNISKLNLPNTQNNAGIVHLSPNDFSTKAKLMSFNPEISGLADIVGTWPSRERCVEDYTDMTWIPTISNQACAGSAAEEDEMGFSTDLNLGKEHSHASMSSMTHSSGESSSSCQIFKESSKKESFVTKRDETYVVKAAYKADIVRFKLLPSMGFLHLYGEVGKRFRLCAGAFQLKYMDDEEEWVMLTGDSDLEECIEVFESTASQCIRLQVRDVLHQIQQSLVDQ